MHKLFNKLSRLPILIHALTILIHWLGFRLSVPYLNTCIVYLNTLTRFPISTFALPIFIHPSPIVIHWLGFWLSAPYLKTCIAYLKTLCRLSAPYLITCTAYLKTLSRLPILKHALPFLYQHDSATNQNRAPLAANHNWVLRHSSREYDYQIMNHSHHTVTKNLSDEKTHGAINTKLFKCLEHINDQLYEVEFAKLEIGQRKPIIVGFFILQYAKLRMLKLYYNFFERFFNVNNFEELEMDTDP